MPRLTVMVPMVIEYDREVSAKDIYYAVDDIGVTRVRSDGEGSFKITLRPKVKLRELREAMKPVKARKVK